MCFCTCFFLDAQQADRSWCFAQLRHLPSPYHNASAALLQTVNAPNIRDQDAAKVTGSVLSTVQGAYSTSTKHGPRPKEPEQTHTKRHTRLPHDHPIMSPASTGPENLCRPKFPATT